jgi:hypothetical protein
MISSGPLPADRNGCGGYRPAESQGISRETELGLIEGRSRPYAFFDMGSGVKIAAVFGETISGA